MDPAGRFDWKAARLAGARRHIVEGVGADRTLERVSSIAARFFDTPMAAVSIVDEDRIWFVSHHGFDIEWVERSPGLCASAIERDQVTVLPDATLDPVAMTNPLVNGGFGLRFYAAAPIRTPDGQTLGTVHVMDREPRKVSDTEVAVLSDLAGVVADGLEPRLGTRTALSPSPNDRSRQ